MNKKVYLIAGTVAMLTMGSMLMMSKVHADDTNSKYPLIVQRLISKFNLNTDEVDNVMDEVRTERQAERQAELEKRLTEAVSSGKITEEQKKLILDKMSEWQDKKPFDPSLSSEERQTLREEHRTEMETWAKENNIDLDLLRQMGPKGQHNGFGKRHGFDEK